MNNNKGFNWFFPIALIAILFFFFSNMNGDSKSNTIDEEAFYKLMVEGKVKEVMVYRDNFKADVFLTKAQKEIEKKNKGAENDPFSAFNLKPQADYSLSYGDLRYFQERFNKITADNPKVSVKMEFGVAENPLTSILFQLLICVEFLLSFIL